MTALPGPATEVGSGVPVDPVILSKKIRVHPRPSVVFFPLRASVRASSPSAAVLPRKGK